jgi:hypothetical protein
MRRVPPFLTVLSAFAAALLLALLSPRPAAAWDEIGHQVVAHIAWENLRPQTRQRAVELLRAAPADADLASLFPEDSRPREDRERELFLRASTWPDIVRDPKKPARRSRYHKSTWHFVNFFFEQRTPASPPRDLPERGPEPVNVVERLEAFRRGGLGDSTRPAGERALELAWVLHLVGDVHQPLHTSARVTPSEPRGDQGGNLFKLGTGRNPQSLHGYWDGVVRRGTRRRSGEGEEAYVARIADGITERHPRASLAARLKPDQFRGLGARELRGRQDGGLHPGPAPGADAFGGVPGPGAGGGGAGGRAGGLPPGRLPGGRTGLLAPGSAPSSPDGLAAPALARRKRARQAVAAVRRGHVRRV